MDGTTTEDSFMKYVRKEKWKRKAGFERKKQHRKPLAYEKQAGSEKHFNEILPEPEVPFEGEPVRDLKISYKQGGKLSARA